jgi:hypothetical protein
MLYADQSKGAGLHLLQHLNINSADYYVELHGVGCNDIFEDKLPGAYGDGSIPVRAHIVPGQPRIAKSSDSTLNDLDVDTAPGALLDVTENALQNTTRDPTKEIALRATGTPHYYAKELSMEDAKIIPDITAFIMTTTNANDEDVHYIRVGYKTYARKSNQELEFVGIVLARVNSAIESVDFVLTDASVLTGVQYGHCDLGVDVNIKALKWTPDEVFRNIDKNSSDYETVLLDVARGNVWVRDVDLRPQLFRARTSKAVQPDAKKLEATVKLWSLPIRPNYKREGQPPVLGDVDSIESIDCVTYWRNETGTYMKLNSIMNKQFDLEPNDDYNAVEHWVLRGDKGFEGLIRFLRKNSTLREYGKDWNVEIFVLAQIPESATMWSWTDSVNDWTAGQWLSGRANEAFDRSLYIEVHIKSILKEDKVSESEAESEQEENLEEGQSTIITNDARQAARRSARLRS